MLLSSTAQRSQRPLTFIQELSTAPVLSATELMRLPPAERRRILASQARQAEAIYRQNPEMIVEDGDAPITAVQVEQVAAAIALCVGY